MEDDNGPEDTEVPVASDKPRFGAPMPRYEDKARPHALPPPRDDSDPAPFAWKKGGLLGKGGFGSVFLGLTDSGYMIAYNDSILLLGLHPLSYAIFWTNAVSRSCRCP